MTETPPIYTIHVMDCTADGMRGKAGSRTWGWLRNRTDAHDAVMCNATDMFECGYYNLCVVEEFTEGVMALAKNRWWYAATFHPGPDNVTTVEAIEQPAWAEGLINWAMG